MSHEHGGGGGGGEAKSGFVKGFEGLFVFITLIPSVAHVVSSKASMDYYLEKLAEAKA
jgi:hypothetical protein